MYKNWMDKRSDISHKSEAITGGSDMKAGLSHVIVIICMSLYNYAQFIMVGR